MKRDQAENQDGQPQLDKVRKTLRGRAEKACVRCRAKKRTCDGGNPCTRCKDSHSACYYSDWHFVVPYPREYVEYLEEQQEQLSSGLLTMYRLLKESNIKTVPPLPEKPQAQDLLTALRGLKLDHHNQSSSNRRSTHPQPHAGHFATPTNGSPTVLGSHFPTQPLQGHLEPSSRSPTLSSMYVPSLPSTQDLNPSAAAASIPTSMPGSFIPGPFGSFDYTRHAQSPMFVSHRHSLPTEYGTAAGLGPPDDLASMGVANSWHHSTALSPVTSIQMSSPTTVMRSPQSLPRGGHGGGDERENMQQHRQHSQQQPQQQQWGGSWVGQAEGGVGLYTNVLGGNNHDSGLGLEGASIERRGEIVLPHDPNTL